ncbi:MAG TPA: ATP-binding protein [Acidobacteriaceae bacterium]|jgi:signal transduction histidine kinase
MTNAMELRQVSVFADLPDDQVEWFLANSVEITLQPGDTYVRHGDPAQWMFVFLEGEIQWVGDFAGNTVVLQMQGGEVSGVLPFSRMKQFMFTGRALTPVRLLRFPASLFPELVQRMPALTTSLVGMMADRIREGTRIEQQRDRLASLGKLSAGLAHELNNPAAAAKSASSQVRTMIGRLRNASYLLGRQSLSDEQRSAIESMEDALSARNAPPLSGLALSEREDELETILRSHGLEDPWEVAAALARAGAESGALNSALGKFEKAQARVVAEKLASFVELDSLLGEIENSTARISDLVRTIKEYTYMDQSPVQDVDVMRSIEATLTILNHKLKHGVTVKRDYQPVPLLVNSFGSELNQVWTNLIDNAIDAMDGSGELRIRTFLDDRFVVVEIADNGPGIPPEVEAHIFEPFFTTKGVGEGTGLGLDTVQRIVRKHGGNIHVTSGENGGACFQVRLPQRA